MRLAAIGFFPATPDAARVLYSDELMRFTSVYMAGGVRMVESLGKALVDFHVANGCVRAKMTRYGETWALQLSSGSSWKLPPGPSAGGPTAHSQHASNQLMYLTARSGRLLVSFLLSWMLHSSSLCWWILRVCTYLLAAELK